MKVLGLEKKSCLEHYLKAYSLKFLHWESTLEKNMGNLSKLS